jgi:hypothetical protein
MTTNEFESVLDAAGYYLAGGGGERDGTGSFDLYAAGQLTTAGRAKAVYLFDDGTWLFHDFARQVDDSPEHATASGRGVEELRACLEALK